LLTLFPTPLKIIENDSFDNKNLVEHCHKLSKNIKSGGKHWITQNVYNTSYTYDICNDKNFSKLNTWIKKQASAFAKDLGFKNTDKIKDMGWFNIYKKNDYQEWHNHNFYLVSAIYYLKTSEASAKTWFKSPLPENPNIPEHDPNNPYTWKRFFIYPKNNTLILFRSDLDHCVESHQNDSERITLAYNFSLGDSI